MGDNIKKPDHYCEGREYEPKDVIRDWGLNFNLGSAVKYISRAGRKGDKLEDLQKAKQFLEFEIEAEAEGEDLKHIVQKIDRGEIDCDNIPSELYSRYKEIRDAVERRTSWYTNGVLGHWYYYQSIPDGYKARVIDRIAQEVLDSQIIPPDEVRAAAIDRIVERIDNDELDCFDIPSNLCCGYQEINTALIIQVLRKVDDDTFISKTYTHLVVKGIITFDSIPDEYKSGVIDRVVEGINNGEIKLKDIPTGLYEERGKIQAAIANSKYRKAADAIRKYAEDTEDTVSINFEFEVDPEIDTDTVNVHVHIKNKED